MAITFSNASTKRWLARKGPTKVFGMNVDIRERLTDDEAVAWFDKVWASSLQQAVERASSCDIEFVRSKLAGNSAAGFISETAKHREFTLSNCFFICQLPNPQTCDQLWFISSTSPDPRTLYVRFESVPVKEAFDKFAKDLGWQKPEELGEKVLLDFMESVTRTLYRTSDQEQRWGLRKATEGEE